MRVKIVVVLLLVFCVSAIALWAEYCRVVSSPVVLEHPRIIDISKGDSFNQITRKLLKQNVNIRPLWFKVLAYEKQITNKLKAGEYELKVGLTMPEILILFVKGTPRQYAITFPEGWNFKQIIDRIQRNPHLEKTLSRDDFPAIMLQLGSQHQSPEGLLFPDTYFFDKNASDLSVLKTAYTKMQRVLKTEWDTREKNIPLRNAYEALILASIVEKETGVAEERGQIAGVFTRRLRKRMLLQTDPTVIYGMGARYQGNLRYRDLRRPTPYNTYVIRGLPPTPIAMPSQAAINAVLHPEKGKSLYFVAKGNGQGTHVFSATLKEHNNAVNKYQRKR